MYTVNPGYETLRYDRKSAFKLGVVQISCGLLAFLFGVMAIFLNALFSEIGSGIWCGCAFIFAGILGIVSSKTKATSCHIVAFMVLSIISAVFALTLFLITLMGIMATPPPHFEYFERNSSFAVAIIILLIIIAVTEGITAIVSSAICCRSTCCCYPRPIQGIVYFYPSQGENQDIEQSANPQNVTLFTVPLSANNFNHATNAGFIVQGLTNIHGQTSVSDSNQNGISLSNSAPPSYDDVTEGKQYHYVSLD